MRDKDPQALRLADRKKVMEIIRRRRAIECDMGIGASIERQIRSREVAEREENRDVADSRALIFPIEFRR